MVRNKIIYLMILVCALFIISCKNQDLSSNATIKYGTSFGMCADYCKRELVLNGAKAIFSKSKNGNIPDTKTCTKQLDETTLAALRKNLDMNLLASLPDVIGCPDCADGGAEFVEITANGKTKKVAYEYGKTPPALVDLIGVIKPVFKSFEDCK